MSVPSFAPLERAAVARHGEDALRARLPAVRTADELRALPDDRYLSTMARQIFAAGFRYKVVQAKWPGTEEAFEGFMPAAVARYDRAREAALAEDRRIVRNPRKIGAIVGNAAIVERLSREHGGFGAWLAAWPVEDTVGLWAALARELHLLGGASGPRFLRGVGRDTFILTPDVLAALASFGVYEGKGTSKRDRAALQAIFEAWRRETGRPLAHLSVLAACSVP